MIRPYHYRICGALPGHEPVEFARFQRAYSPHDWNAAKNGISRDWEVWCEFTLDDKHTLTPRVHIYNRNVGGGPKIKIAHLAPEEVAP